MILFNHFHFIIHLGEGGGPKGRGKRLKPQGKFLNASIQKAAPRFKKFAPNNI